MKVLIVGLGSMGKRRIRMLLRLMPSNCIFGVDTQQARRDEVSQLYEVASYDDLQNAFSAQTFDCGFICTSPLGHHFVAKVMLKAGISVFSEINLVNDGHEELIALARQKGVKYFLSSTPLYSMERICLAEHIHGIGPVTYQYHVGQYLPDWHPWEDYKDFFVGSKVTNGCREIMAIEFPWLIHTFGEVESVEVKKKKVSSLEIDYPDTYLIMFTHKNGNSGTFMVDIVSRKAVRELKVINEDLYLTWGGTPTSVMEYNFDNKCMQNIPVNQKNERDAKYAEFINETSYYEEVIAFFDYLCGKAQPKHTLKDDIAVLKLIDGIESVKA